MCSRHPQRLKEIRVCPLSKRLLGDLGNDGSKQVVARVRVGMFLARSKVQVALSAHHREYCVHSDDIRRSDSRQHQRFKPVAHSAGVIQEMSDGDGSAEVWNLRQM